MKFLSFVKLILVNLLLVFLLAGCGDTKSNEPTNNESSTSESSDYTNTGEETSVENQLTEKKKLEEAFIVLKVAYLGDLNAQVEEAFSIHSDPTQNPDDFTAYENAANCRDVALDCKAKTENFSASYNLSEDARVELNDAIYNYSLSYDNMASAMEYAMNYIDSFSKEDLYNYKQFLIQSAEHKKLGEDGMASVQNKIFHTDEAYTKALLEFKDKMTIE